MKKIIDNMPMSEYQEAHGLSNHTLQIFLNSPANYIWNKTAPKDNSKTKTQDIGTALHALLLEPETFEEQILVSDVKTRTAKAFEQLQTDNPTKTVLTEEELQQVKLMAMSANCHPTFKYYLDLKGRCESSIFVTCPVTGLILKIRPDKLIDSDKSNIILLDVKSTANISDWRSDKEWTNPLFKLGYAHTAAFYMHVASIYYGYEINEYKFLAAQSSISLGKYPVSVFNITRSQLNEYGIFDELITSLKYFKECSDKQNWLTEESFPSIRIYKNEEMQVTFED